MKKTLMYYITIILTILFILVNTYSYAAEITKESLTKFFDIFNNPFQITDDKIIGSISDLNIDFTYDLTDKPTFYTETILENEMTYEKCNDEAAKFLSLMYAFASICSENINDINTANKYFADKISENSSYIEYTNTTISKEDFTNAKDYVEKRFAKDIIVDDELFSLSIKKQDIGNGVYKIISKLVVNSEKDFSIITGKTTVNLTTNTTTPTPLPTSSTANIGTMPNAGFQINALNILKIVLGLSLAGVILYTIYNKRYSSK